MLQAGQKPLAIHMVLHDTGAKVPSPAVSLATALYARLSRGSRPVGIPVHFWRGVEGPTGELELPCQPILTEAARNAIVVLVDHCFFEARKEWQRYLESLKQSLLPKRDLLLPISICGNAQRVADVLTDINCVQVVDPETIATDEQIFHAIYTALLQLLPESDSQNAERPSGLSSTYATGASVTRVFLCHAKSDGDLLARTLRQYIYEKTQLACFFDIHDIPHGRPVRECIRAFISTSCLLVVWTDRLLESRWCQFEILEARSQQRPILVLDGLSTHSPRIFPFLSNMPVVHWQNNPAEVVSALLLELVRTRYTKALFELLRGKDSTTPRFILHPPDIMEASSVLRIRDGNSEPSLSTTNLLVYPDPPLAAEELTFLRDSFHSLHLYSLSEWLALRAAGLLPEEMGPSMKERPVPLSQMSIGLSVSETESWRSLGLITDHQDDFVIDVARELILLGARLLWGGDMRPSGLGDRLEVVVRAYHQSDHPPQDHVACYLAWPVHQNVPAEDLRERRKFADVLCLSHPGVSDLGTPAFRALCFSAMRQKLARDSQARIVWGGKLKGYQGRYPGIVEEAFETIRLGRPLYIVGGFGGAARAVYDAIVLAEAESSLRKAWNERIEDEKIRETHAAYNHLAHTLNLDLSIDHEGLLGCFKNLGPEEFSKRNKLSLSENDRLASSQNIHEIMALLVKGLNRLSVVA